MGEASDRVRLISVMMQIVYLSVLDGILMSAGIVGEKGADQNICLTKIYFLFLLILSKTA